MAWNWITPKTNWQSGDFCTHADINRIRENILYLYDAIGVTPIYPTMLPTLAVGNQLTVNGYNWVQEEVFRLYALIGGTSDYQFIFNKTINSSPWSSTELNTIESLLLECYEIVDSGDYELNYEYAGSGLYADNNALL